MTTDVVVLGTGAGGLIAALAAAEAGASVAIYEKADAIGGTTAISGGTVWMPGNRHMPPDADSREAALAYLHSLSLAMIDPAAAEVIVDDGPATIEWLESVTAMRFDPLTEFPDYHPDNPGGRVGRSLDPDLFAFERLGRWADRVVRAHRNPHARLADIPIGGGSGFLADEVVAERERHDQRGCGSALIGPLLEALLAHGIEPVLGAQGTDLIVGEGRVLGAQLQTADGPIDAYARKGVVLATGGFEWDPDLVRQFLRGPMTSPASPPFNTGDGLRMAMRAGADLANMSEAWWVPTMEAAGDEAFGRQRAALVLRERTLPGSIMVNRQGRRFADEAANYNAFGGALHALDPTRLDYLNLPCWLIFDQGFVDRYGFHLTPPGGTPPDWVVRGGDPQELAATIAVPGSALVATIERWNEQVAKLTDTDFGRGANAHDRWLGDRDRQGAAATLGALEQPPFYAVEVHSGCLGTKGGARTDLHGQVIDTRGRPIEGFFAVGNVAAAPTGRAYGGAGGTLGPIFVFARRAGARVAAARPALEVAR